MANNINTKLLVAGVVLSVLVGTSSLASAKEEGQNNKETLLVHLIETLNLRPDKARILMQIEEKYDRVRQEALERIQKSEEHLEKLLSGEKPDEGKLKELTTAIISDQDILVKGYKARRDETLAILTPVQKGKYLLATWKWQQKLLGKYEKHKTGQQDEKQKEKAP